ncbi:Aste57867_23953 [Aphanomyces stellatus]|uniref:Aste57867_23953 protein n=1 Tax=Aphanomyces stellatus TaxID=120398 RepID=A0A485LQQ1_9STRA|nr:hypothetical protein As57867_023880 [Aphanomyces stellatus]VFU00596.1 Aste57867_23953 [Aphanomyces stellatus]
MNMEAITTTSTDKRNRADYFKEYRRKNKAKIAAQQKKYRECNKGKIQEYKERNKDKVAAYHKEYREKYRERNLAQMKLYYERNKAYFKEYYLRNKQQAGKGNTFVHHLDGGEGDDMQSYDVRQLYHYAQAHASDGSGDYPHLTDDDDMSSVSSKMHDQDSLMSISFLLNA